MELIIARNPEPDTILPFLLRVPRSGGLVFWTKGTWPELRRGTAIRCRSTSDVVLRTGSTLSTMRRIPVRDLNQHTADVLAIVERGERVEITRNGTRVAIIEPAQPDPAGRLIESGDLRPARGRLPLLSASDVSAADASGLEAVLEDRYGAGRW